jgi:dihydroorotate dehydrogenase electron transfer subunit
LKQSLASLTTSREVIPGIHLIWLESPDIASTAQPGQFVMVRCGEDNELLLRRPLSIHQVDTTKTKLALLFNVVGKGTLWLSQRKAGDSIDLFGPLGNGFSIKPNSKNLLLVAGGMGIAPLHFLAERAKSQGYMVHFHEAVNTAGQLMLDALSPRYVRVPYSGAPAAAALYGRADTIAGTASTADGSAFIKGLATVCVPGLADWADQIFACGPVPMYKAMAQMKELKEKPVQVSLEMRMGCGLGVCYGCTVKTRSGLKQVCKDGPVFELSDLTDINWDELVL